MNIIPTLPRARVRSTESEKVALSVLLYEQTIPWVVDLSLNYSMSRLPGIAHYPPFPSTSRSTALVATSQDLSIAKGAEDTRCSALKFRL